MRRALDARLRRLEAAARSRTADDVGTRHPLDKVMELFRQKLIEIRRAPLVGAEHEIADTAERWIETFEPIRDLPIHRECPFLLPPANTTGNLTGLARNEFDAFWRRAFPDRPLSEDRFTKFGWLISDLAKRIFVEAVWDGVPIGRRRYFLDPDNWAIRRQRTQDGANSAIYMLRFITRPKGALLKRAVRLARDWGRREPGARDVRVVSGLMDGETPLAWAHRTRPRAAGGSVA
jgi:hypothetical protein